MTATPSLLHKTRPGRPAAAADPPAAGSARHRHYPCTPAQRRLWLLDQLDPGNPALNLAARWQLEGPLNPAQLEQAFRLVIVRHAVLRTAFERRDGEPWQRVEPAAGFVLPVTDLSALPEALAQAEAERLAQIEARTRFDLSQAPLMRARLLRLSANRAILLVTVHHCVCDETSLALLARELGELCTALQQQRPPRLPPLGPGYGSFAAATQATSAPPAQARAYWQKKLQGIRHFELTPDRPRAPLRSGQGAICSQPLERDALLELEALARREGATLEAGLLALWLVLLHRYSGEGEIVSGYQSLARPAEPAALQHMLGLFADIQLLREDLSGDPPFAQLLRELAGALAAAAAQPLPLEQLLEIAQPQPDSSRNALCSVNFTLRRALAGTQASVSSVDSARSTLRMRELPELSPGVIFDLDFAVIECGGECRLACEYSADLYEPETIARLLRYYANLLRGALKEPERRISNLPLLDATERRALLRDLNQTAAAYPELCLPQLFEAQAARTPHATALVCGERTLSYRELDRAANQLAQELRTRGVVPAARVGVFVERSPELVIALLAVLKTGGAYVPLDPIYPAERLRHVLDNAQPALIVTRSSLSPKLPATQIPLLELDREAARLIRRSDAPLAPAAVPEDVAYVIYTSGSTGVPKGVQVLHRGVANFLWAMRARPGLDARDRLLAVTTVSFDIAVLELFLPLIVGARVIIATEGEAADGARLLELLRRHDVTVMQATPVNWQLLLEAGWDGQPPLRMLCGGEALPRPLADRLLARGGELWNMYGPTETTVWSSACRVLAGSGPVPIGAPIANTQFYALDGHLQPVAPGAPGELYIGGDGVARGYLGLPHLTAERFVPDPFRDAPGARLYRTGDTVRMRRGGCIEFLGRGDQQVKLRGFRIELGELESVLLGHPRITEAVAILGKEPSGEAALWAYAVPRGGAEQQELREALRARLAQALPAYMQPAALVLLEALPRLANGKIDRRSLPAPVRGSARAAARPATATEQRLAQIWCAVLGLEQIDTRADFFESGGHSLLAARLIARIEAEFGRRLSLAALFQAPSIAAQARLIEQNDAREYDFRQVVRLQPQGSRPPLIAIHNTGVYYYNLSKRLGPEQPLIALQLFDPALPRPELPPTLEAIAAEYAQLIRKLQPRGPYALIGWCVGGILAFEVARQLAHEGEELSLVAMIDAWAPGYYRRLPKLRARLADYSYRVQLIYADWQRVLARRHSFAAFLLRRTLIRKLLRLLRYRLEEPPAPADFESRVLSAENYDQWLLGYMEQLADRYEPRLYPGKITLLCSAQEPKGLFLDPQMGWGAFAAGIDLARILGDHFTVFKGRGLEQMAAHVAAAMAAHAKTHRPAAAEPLTEPAQST